MIKLEDLKLVPPAEPLKLVYSGPLHYKGHYRQNAVCHLAAYDSPSLEVLIATEVPENTGLSVTNGIENVAVAAEDLLMLPVLEKGTPEKVYVFIEHYTPDSYRGRGGEEDFSIVTFKAEYGSCKHYGAPDWIHVEREEVEKLIGGSLAYLA